MWAITFSAEDRRALAHDRYHHPDPRVRRKMEVLWLKSHGLTHDAIAAYAPDLRSKIVHSELLTPADIERTMRISGGHWHHGELAFDQFLMLRPTPGAAHYATPVPGLYLCGAGCHPGGGVMGTAGRHAASAVLEQAA